MSNYDFSLKERVVRLSVAAGLIFGIVSSIIWYVSGTYYDDDALFFGIPLGLITFISGLIHFKSHNPLGKFLPFATVFVYFIFFAGDSDFNDGFEISFGIFLSLNICLVATFLFGLLMNWIDKGN
jgi:hypothetical protein